MNSEEFKERKAELDSEAEQEAKLAINQVLDAQRGRAAYKLKSELRKAFPFGPRATAKEKQIWSDLLKKTMDDLSQWPKALPLAVLLVFLVLPPALPSTEFTRDGAGVWYQVQDDGVLKAVAAKQVPLKKRVKQKVRWVIDKAVAYAIECFIIKIFSK